MEAKLREAVFFATPIRAPKVAAPRGWAAPAELTRELLGGGVRGCARGERVREGLGGALRDGAGRGQKPDFWCPKVISGPNLTKGDLFVAWEHGG